MTYATHPHCGTLGPNGRHRTVIADLDGTLAHMNGRKPFDWHRVHEDLPNGVVIDLLRRYSHDHCILVVTGRSEECREATLAWLLQHGVPWCQLYMRPAGDYRKDAEVKRELWEREIAPWHSVALCLDDRAQSVDFWRGLGLVCLQVAPGSF
jgi:hypothetical protein